MLDRSQAEAAARLAADAEELAHEIETKSGDDIARVREILPELDEAAIAIGILIDHFAIVREKLDAVRRRLREASK
jgi:hypothetical protein